MKKIEFPASFLVRPRDVWCQARFGGAGWDGPPPFFFFLSEGKGEERKLLVMGRGAVLPPVDP